MAGNRPPRLGAFLRDLREGVGPVVALIASDGFADFPTLIEEAGAVAEGMYVGQYGVPNQGLPTEGKRFLSEFAATRDGDPGPDFSAAYAAQAAEMLLDAVARSNGTRASVGA